MPKQAVSLKISIAGSAGFTASLAQEITPDTMTRSSFDLAKKNDKGIAALPAVGTVSALVVTATVPSGKAAAITIKPTGGAAAAAAAAIALTAPFVVVNTPVLTTLLGDNRQIEVTSNSDEPVSVVVLSCV